jgi:arylsulfatase A-like enzyme
MNWPGHIKSQEIEEVVHIVDWFPTLASLIEFAPREAIAWDGADLCPVLFDRRPLGERDLYWIWNTRVNRWALRHGDWKIVRYAREEPTKASDWQLYNLKKDPGEKDNVAASCPEIVTELHQRYVRQQNKDRKAKWSKPTGE